MNIEIAEELLKELGSSLESLEAQQTALLQLLRDKGIVTDDQLDPYLMQSGKASNVRWRAVRIRLDSLLSAEKEKLEQAAEKERKPTAGLQTSIPKHQETTPSENGTGDSEAATHRSGHPPVPTAEAKSTQDKSSEGQEIKASEGTKGSPK